MKKPIKENTCDKCGSALHLREDDKPKAVKKRLEVYKKQTEPLIEFYTDKSLIVNINASPGIKDITNNILSSLSS